MQPDLTGPKKSSASPQAVVALAVAGTLLTVAGVMSFGVYAKKKEDDQFRAAHVADETSNAERRGVLRRKIEEAIEILKMLEDEVRVAKNVQDAGKSAEDIRKLEVCMMQICAVCLEMQLWYYWFALAEPSKRTFIYLKDDFKTLVHRINEIIGITFLKVIDPVLYLDSYNMNIVGFNMDFKYSVTLLHSLSNSLGSLHLGPSFVLLQDFMDSGGTPVRKTEAEIHDMLNKEYDDAISVMQEIRCV